MKYSDSDVQGLLYQFELFSIGALNFVDSHTPDCEVIFCFGIKSAKKVKLTFALFDDIFSRQIVASADQIRMDRKDILSRHSKLPCKARAQRC